MMKLGPELLKITNKTYEPSAWVNTTFKRYDIAFKTDEKGRPVLLYIGKREVDGNIKGERFARRIVENEEGEVVKDHWDNKGKAS